MFMATDDDGPKMVFDDNPAAPEIFAADAFGFWLHNGVLTVTMTSDNVDHRESPGPITRRVVARIVMPIEASQRLAAGLYDFLKQRGLDPVPRSSSDKVQ